MSTQTIEAAPAKPGADVSAALDLVRRVVESWKAGDANRFSSVFSPTAILVLPGRVMKGRDQIRTEMAAEFAGRWAGTHVYGAPVEIRQIGDDAILLVSEGGPHQPGATKVPANTAIRAMWLFAKVDGEWLVTAYTNTPARRAVPLREAK